MLGLPLTSALFLIERNSSFLADKGKPMVSCPYPQTIIWYSQVKNDA